MSELIRVLLYEVFHKDEGLEASILLISMLHFPMCNILKFTQNSIVVLIPYLLTYSQQCFVTTLLTSCCVYGCLFCFNGFNRFTWFNMDRIMKNDPCLIKTIKTDYFPP